jgi:hypothetical protein
MAVKKNREKQISECQSSENQYRERYFSEYFFFNELQGGGGRQIANRWIRHCFSHMCLD